MTLAGPAGPDLEEVVASLVLAVPGVASLHGGAFGEITTYLPGRRVIGVRMRPDCAQLHVVLHWGASILGTADEIRSVLTPLVARRVDITVVDVIDDDLTTSRSTR